MRKCVLVLDNDPLVVSAMARELGRSFDVATATTFIEGMDLVDGRRDFCAVISELDLGLAGSGILVLDEVRQRRRGSCVRVLISRAAGADAPACAADVAHVFLQKPWGPDELLHTVRLLVDGDA